MVIRQHPDQWLLILPSTQLQVFTRSLVHSTFLELHQEAERLRFSSSVALFFAVLTSRKYLGALFVSS
jgi:hypothetical protein